MNSSQKSIIQYSLIFDDIYTQKQKVFSSKVSRWQDDKQKFLNENFKKPINSFFIVVEAKHKRFEKIIHQLLKIINAEYQMVCKAKIIGQDKEYQKSQSLISQSQDEKFTDQTQMFQKIFKNIHKRSVNIHQISEFSSRFFAITSTELNQFKSLTSQIQNLRQRSSFDLKKQTEEQTKIIQELCLKNESKYFHLKNFQKLRQSLKKQTKILQKTFYDTRQYHKQSLLKRRQILKDCVDNMTKFEQLYTKVFCDNFIGVIRQYFSKSIGELTKEIEEFEQNQKSSKTDRLQVDKQLENLHQKNIQIFNLIMQDITMGEWRHTVLQITKKSSFSSFTSMGFGSQGSQTRQNQIQNKTSSNMIDFKNQLNSGQQNQMIMTLTVDYKLLFRKQIDRNKIFKEYLLNELKIKNEKQTKKVIDSRKLTLKDKNTKENVELTFSDCDKTDGFLLHMERFNQLRNSISK